MLVKNENISQVGDFVLPHGAFVRGRFCRRRITSGELCPGGFCLFRLGECSINMPLVACHSRFTKQQTNANASCTPVQYADKQSSL